MGELRPGLLGRAAAGRPLLSGAMIGFAAAALASVAYRQPAAAFTDASIAFLAAIALVVAVAAGAAAAPGNFWLRVIYAGIGAGLVLAGRRLFIQNGHQFGSFDADLALTAGASSLFVLSLGAPLWRGALANALVGLTSIILAAAAGLSIVGIETTRSGPAPMAGFALAFAAAAGMAHCIQMSAAYTRAFAGGAAANEAAAAAAGLGAAPAFFSLCVGASAAAISAFALGDAKADILAAAFVSAGATAFACVCAIFFLAGSLALKPQTEIAAVVENRRRTALRPLLKTIRDLLPPSSAIAVSAIFLIIALVAAFEAATPASVGEIALISVVAVSAALSFISLRTALMATIYVASTGRIAVWAVEISGMTPPSETIRTFATALAAVLAAQLFLAWRDSRNPRRKTREVVQMALADALFAYIAAAILAVAAVAASDVAGVWRDGSEAALYTAVLALLGVFMAPPLMTSVGALFGRD